MENRLRILYIIGGASKALGSEQVAMEILKQLSHNNVEYTVITANNGPINKLCDELQIENYSIPFDFYVYRRINNVAINCIKKIVKCIKVDIIDLLAMRRIESLIDLTTYDLIHTNISRNLLGARLAKKYRIRHVWGLQELLNGHYGLDLLKPNQINWMNKHCSSFIAVSNIVKKNWIQGGLDKDKIVRIYNGIDIECFKNNKHLRQQRILERKCDSRIKLVMMGSLCEAKGQHILLEAINQLGELKDRFTVDFYGEGYGGEDDEYLKLLKYKSSTYSISSCFHGFVMNSSSELYQYDVGINCSKGEAFGLSTIEYMCSGLCVVASDTGANKEILIDSSLGYIFDLNSIPSLTRILKSLVDSFPVIDAIGNNAADYVENKFPVSRFINEIESVYKDFS